MLQDDLFPGNTWHTHSPAQAPASDQHVMDCYMKTDKSIILLILGQKMVQMVQFQN